MSLYTRILTGQVLISRHCLHKSKTLVNSLELPVYRIVPTPDGTHLNYFSFAGVEGSVW